MKWPPDHRALFPQDGAPLEVAVNVDTGMSRYGVQPRDLEDLMGGLEDLGVGVRSIYTHFQSAITETEKNQRQMDKFTDATRPDRLEGATLLGCSI